MFGRVAEKHAHGGARRKLVRSDGRKVRVTLAAKNAKVRVGGGNTKERKKRCGKIESFGGLAIEKVGSGVKSLNPVRGREAGLKHKRPNNVISGTNNTFGLAILLRGVWT